MKLIVLLVGPKGSGKSTIGDLLGREAGIHFLRVEPIFLQVRAELGAAHPVFEKCGFQAVLDRTALELLAHDRICIESTGVSAHFPWFFAELGRQAEVVPVQIRADLPQCRERIRTRDTSIHIPVSDDQVDRINDLAAQVQLPWSAILDNRGPFDPEQILTVFRNLLEGPSPR